MVRTVAVTGASGFIGRRLIERLGRDGFAVRVLVHNHTVEADIAPDQLTTVKGSMADAKSLAALIEGVDAVVHLAGLIKARRRRDFFEVNAKGVSRLIAAMGAGSGRSKVVLISSLAAREPGLSSYAASKRCGEAVLLDIDDGLPWTVLRPPAVYGPGDRETLSLFRSVRRGIGAMVGGRDARFSLLHVDDLVDAVLVTLEPGCADRLILELDDGASGGHSWPSMIEAAAREMDVAVRCIGVPKAGLLLLGHVNRALGLWPGYVPMLTPEKVRELTHPDWVADSRLILAKTAWRPAMPIDRGFPATIAWYRLHSWL